MNDISTHARSAVFDGALTVAEINERYKEAFRKNGCDRDDVAYWSLSEAHRRALSAHTVTVAAERTNRVQSDPNRVMPKQIRKWAAEQKIPLGKGGRVTPQVDQAYREAHGLEVRESRRRT